MTHIYNVSLVGTHNDFKTASFEVENAQSSVGSQYADLCVRSINVTATHSLINLYLRDESTKVPVPYFDIAASRRRHVKLLSPEQSLDWSVVQLNDLFNLARKVVHDEQLTALGGYEDQRWFFASLRLAYEGVVENFAS